MHTLFTILNGLMTLLVLALIGVGGAIYFAKLQFDKPGPLDEDTVIVIAKGNGVNTIAALLEGKGIISDRRIFVASVIYFKAQEKLKAGEYRIPSHASMRTVLDRLVEGKSILYKVTIPEGFTSSQVVRRILKAKLLEGPIVRVPPEGTLLPDTYQYSRKMDRRELVRLMQSSMVDFVSEQWQEREPDLPITTPQEVVILASIVEKETGKADERPLIAGVFYNRLRKGMRLQSDPTVIYGLTKGREPLGRPIYTSDLEKATPYNTYLIDGLPPTPIANPGRAAIKAVLNPAPTDALYFVADGTGGHVFAATLEEHNRNVARWRKVESQRREKKRRRAVAESPEAVARLVDQAVRPPQDGAAPAVSDPAVTAPAAALAVPTPPAPPATTAAVEDPPAAVAEDVNVPLPTRKPRS